MKLLKIYLGVATVFIVIAIGLGIYVWYTVQKLSGAVGGEGEATSIPVQSDSAEVPGDGPEGGE